MGNETRHYLGAYLEIKVSKVEEERTIQACENGHEGRDKFCKDCGLHIFEQLKYELSYPDLWDLLGKEYEDYLQSITPYNLWYSETIIAIGNLLDRPRGMWLHLSTGDSEEISDFPQPDELTTELLVNYNEVIEYLRELDCVTSVEVKAGYVLDAEH